MSLKTLALDLELLCQELNLPVSPLRASLLKQQQPPSTSLPLMSDEPTHVTENSENPALVKTKRSTRKRKTSQVSVLNASAVDPQMRPVQKASRRKQASRSQVKPNLLQQQPQTLLSDTELPQTLLSSTTDIHTAKVTCLSTNSSVDFALPQSEVLSCFRSVVQTVLVPLVVEPCEDMLRFQFQSELVLQLAMCCARQTLSSLDHSEELGLGDFISLLTRGLFSLRLGRSVSSI